MFTQGWNHLMMHFSDHVPVKQAVHGYSLKICSTVSQPPFFLMISQWCSNHCSLVCNMLFILWMFSKCSLCVWVLVVWLYVYMCILNLFYLGEGGVHEDSWIYKFMSSTKFGEISTTISSNIFSAPFTLSFPSWTIIIRIWDLLILFHKFLRLYSFFLQVSNYSYWILSIDLFSSSLTLPSVISNLLLSRSFLVFFYFWLLSSAFRQFRFVLNIRPELIVVICGPA